MERTDVIELVKEYGQRSPINPKKDLQLYEALLDIPFGEPAIANWSVQAGDHVVLARPPWQNYGPLYTLYRVDEVDYQCPGDYKAGQCTGPISGSLFISRNGDRLMVGIGLLSEASRKFDPTSGQKKHQVLFEMPQIGINRPTLENRVNITPTP